MTAGGLSYLTLEGPLVWGTLEKFRSKIVDVAQERGQICHDKRLIDWLGAIDTLPKVQPTEMIFNSPVVSIGGPEILTSKQNLELNEALIKLKPWRKGPFRFFNQLIDTEWRSDLKWSRISKHIGTLEGMLVLDVGCGSGYHCWRMLGDGAGKVLGIEPSLLYCAQFESVQTYMRNPNISVLPLRLEDLPPRTEAFDTTFSMGVLYHRRSPFDHLLRLRETLRPGGQLVLETLIVDGPLHHVFVPEGRYAQMRNVWCLPSPLTIEHWLKKVGFKNITMIDVNQTTAEEQRSTPWIFGHSLANFLDPQNPNLTIEGYPAPTRATWTATR